MEQPLHIMQKMSEFNSREVGLTHPDVFSYIKLADNGDIHIMVDNGVGIILSASQQAIFLVADTVKFLTKDHDGLKWNKVAFNPKATKYSESTFVYPRTNDNNIYSNVQDYLE